MLKALRDGRYNARPEYGEALEYYLDDLPKVAGAGNILLANDQVRILHVMFLADAAMLPEGFASRLKSVIANQFALNAFYDLVQRHNEAVSAGNWSWPFPLDAAKGFFGAVEDNTPRWFEREVEQGLRQVERAEPPAAAPPEPTSPSASAVEPPPLPPGTPDARTFLAAPDGHFGERAVGDVSARAGDAGGAGRVARGGGAAGEHFRPIIEFLRANEPRRVKIEDIQKLVAAHYSVSRTHILSSRRTAVVVKPRQVAMFLAKTLTMHSLPEIGRRFGGRDQTTVLHAVRKIEAMSASDAALRKELELLKRMLQE